jgi:diphosphomevalonate decarboxylase
MATATWEAPSNIALVKYWGLRDPDRMLPFNSSFSVTLDRARTRTAVTFDPSLRSDEFLLNGERNNGPPAEELSRFLDRVRALSGFSDHARVVSRNNFPTASGLASSASGFAALAGAASQAARLRLSRRALSRLARMGSGSACRSVFGGFVEWHAGRRADGEDCYAESVFGPGHWPELVDLVVLVRDAPSKAVRSTYAMQTTVATARGYDTRIAQIPARIQAIRRAIRARSTEKLFPVVMEECDSFREVCESSRPSLDYLTATSRGVLATVREVNENAGEAVAAYTHDAGAHVHVFTTESRVRSVSRAIRRLPGIHRTLIMRAGPGAHDVASRAGR